MPYWPSFRHWVRGHEGTYLAVRPIQMIGASWSCGKGPATTWKYSLTFLEQIGQLDLYYSETLV